MKITVTNRLGLPEAIVHAVANDSYNPGEASDYTATGLLKPARMAQLMKSAEISEDAADRLHALQGQVIHSILERAGDALKADGFIVEERFYADFIVDGKSYKVSAQVDLFHPIEGVLSDYKYTSVGASKHGLKEDHRLQLNLQAELLRRNGHTVKQAEVVLLLRDWSAERVYAGYPESPALKQTVKFMESLEVEAWVADRIRAHEAAQATLPLCSSEEMWQRPTFAVMKSLTAKRATKLFKTREEAGAFIAGEGAGQIIVERPGEPVRCLRYCPVRSVCTQAPKLEEIVAVVEEDGMVRV